MDARDRLMLETLWREREQFSPRIAVTPPLYVRQSSGAQNIWLRTEELAPGEFFAEILGNTGLAYTWKQRQESEPGVWVDGLLVGTLNAYYAQPTVPAATVVAAGTMVKMRASVTARGTFEFLRISQGLTTGNDTVPATGSTADATTTTLKAIGPELKIVHAGSGETYDSIQIPSTAYTQTLSYLSDICLAVVKDGDGFVKNVYLTKVRRTATMLAGTTFTDPTCAPATADGCCPGDPSGSCSIIDPGDCPYTVQDGPIYFNFVNKAGSATALPNSVGLARGLVAGPSSPPYYSWYDQHAFGATGPWTGFLIMWISGCIENDFYAGRLVNESIYAVYTPAPGWTYSASLPDSGSGFYRGFCGGFQFVYDPSTCEFSEFVGTIEITGDPVSANNGSVDIWVSGHGGC